MAEGALRELAAVFEVAFDPKGELKAGDKKIEGMIATLKTVGKIVTEAFALDQIKEFVFGQVESALALEHTANRLGLTTEQLQQYKLTAGLAGVGTDEFTFSLSHLSRTIGEAAAKGGDGAAVFQKLGVKLKDGSGNVRDTGDIFEDLAERISALPNPTEKSRVAFELFGRQGARLLPLLNKGREGFAEARKMMEELGGPTSKEFIENAKKVEESQVRLKFVWNNVSQAIAATFLPKVITVINFFVRMGKAAIDLNKQTNILKTGLLVLSAVAIAKVITQLGELARVAGVTGVRTALAFAAPILIATALYLAFDEIYTLLNGGDTIIGRAADKFLGFGAAVDVANDLRDAWQDFLNVLEAVGNAAGDVATIISNIGAAALPNMEESSGMGAEGGGFSGMEATDDAKTKAAAAQVEISHALADFRSQFTKNWAKPGTTIGQASVRDFYAAGNQGPPPQTVRNPGGAELPSLNVTQEMHFQNNPGDPMAVAKAAKSGVADAHARANYNAKIATARP